MNIDIQMDTADITMHDIRATMARHLPQLPALYDLKLLVDSKAHVYEDLSRRNQMNEQALLEYTELFKFQRTLILLIELRVCGYLRN